MNYHFQEPLREQARISASSIILLTIFVSAVLFIAYAGLTRPWADDDATAPRPALEETADDTNQDDAASDGQADVTDGDPVALQRSE